MRNKSVIMLIFVFLGFYGLKAQENERKLPNVTVKTLSGEDFNTSEIQNDGPIFISFWATWCKPCIKELIAIDENYLDWIDETGVKVYAVSIDDSKSSSRVAPFVNGKAWEFEILLDANSDFKRAMNVVDVPHAFLLDKKGNIVWEHTSYSPGDEEKLHELLVKLANDESIEND